IEIDAERDVVSAALARRQVVHFRRLAGGAIAAARHRADAVSATRWVEARADDHRKGELVLAVVVGEGVEVDELHVDRLAGLDVRHRLGEDVGPLLRKQRGDVPLLFRLGVGALGFGALADDAADAPFAEGHDELIHRRVLRQREDVDRFDLLVVWVLVLLHDPHAGDVAGDARLHVGMRERQRDLLDGSRRLGAQRRIDRVLLRRWGLGAEVVGAGDHPQLFAGRGWRELLPQVERPPGRVAFGGDQAAGLEAITERTQMLRGRRGLLCSRRRWSVRYLLWFVFGVWCRDLGG